MNTSNPPFRADDRLFPRPPRVLEKMSILEHLKTSWQFFFLQNKRTPDVQLPMNKVAPSSLAGGSGERLQVIWLGHSSILLNIDGHTLLTDPLFKRRVSPLGPTRFHSELALTGEDLPAIDVVIISHDHYDHLNKYSVQLLAAKARKFIVPLGVGKRLVNWGVAKEKIIELGWWEEYSPADTLSITATPAQHFSGRGLTDRNKTLWASWSIISPAHRVFFSGDSGYFQGFREIGEKFGPFDMTFIECGAYNERWPEVHMFPEQTVQAHLDLTGKMLQPIHWATFNLALHPWYEPIERLIAAAHKARVKTSTPVIGQIVDCHTAGETFPWWRSVMS